MELSGLILLMEELIPLEFRAIQLAVECTYPNTFKIQKKDSELEKQKKRQQRIYIDDHIYHDVRYHYPRLYECINKLCDTEAKLLEIENGIRFIGKQKIDFYAHFLMDPATKATFRSNSPALGPNGL